MSDKGKLFRCVNNGGLAHEFTVGRLYECVNDYYTDAFSFIDDNGDPNGFSDGNMRRFERAGEQAKSEGRIPFDLEKALAGDPVVTRGGKRVSQIAHFPDAEYHSRVYAMIEGDFRPVSVSEHGRLVEGISLSDLFMEPMERTYYVNVYRYKGAPGYYTGSPLESAISAAEHSNCGEFVKTILFTVPE